MHFGEKCVEHFPAFYIGANVRQVGNIDDKCKPCENVIMECVQCITWQFALRHNGVDSFTVRCHANLKQGWQWVYLALVEVGHRNIKSSQMKSRTVHSKLVRPVWIIHKFGDEIHNTLIPDALVTDLCKSYWCDKLFTVIFSSSKYSCHIREPESVFIIKNNVQYNSHPITYCDVSLKQRLCTHRCFGFTDG